MGEEISNKQVILSNYVKTSVKESDLSLRTSKIQLKIPSGCDGAVLVKNLYLSIDPFILALMKNQELDLPSFTLDSPIYGFGVSKVLDSSHPNFKTGELVWGFTGWEEYSLIKDPDQLFKVQDKDLPLSYFIGILVLLSQKGGNSVCLCCIRSCWSARWSVCKDHRVLRCWECGEQRKGQNLMAYRKLIRLLARLVVDLCDIFLLWQVYVSHLMNKSAFALMKVDLLKNKFRYFPDGIDIYFDNVGGKMLEAVLNSMRLNGRVALCGMISQYNSLEQPEGVHNLINALVKRVHMEGFFTSDHYYLYPKFLEMVVPLIKEEKITYVEDIAEGIESAPGALFGLYSGRNVGKLLVVVSRE
ncbi:(+)-pulegone reductase-like isoform X1 [Salvia splendens]|uniref:(+)-pulegone reductase-like isoform X1 n=1 Tax=Salvia splendens TaxID=180675 RepID=UPI001C2558AB|nr:(+)-pulegone reductase-like isoform X1 [Salvia splendens]